MDETTYQQLINTEGRLRWEMEEMVRAPEWQRWFRLIDQITFDALLGHLSGLDTAAAKEGEALETGCLNLGRKTGYRPLDRG